MGGNRLIGGPSAGLLVGALLASCAGSKDDGGTDSAIPEDAIALLDENNYAYSGTMNVPSTSTAAGEDVTFSWGDMALDMQCHDVDPVDDIDNLAVLAFRNLSEDEVEVGLSDDSLQQVDLGVYINYEPGDAITAQLTDFTFYGTDPEILEYYTEGSGTWLVIATTGTQVAVGTRALSFIKPVAGETNHDVAIGDSCDVLDFSATLADLVPVPVSADGPWTFAWAGLTTNGLGLPITLTNIDLVMIGRYPDLTLDELQARFLDLELLADALWTLPIASGSYADLADATDSEGSSFSGFDGDGTWLLSLRCTTCPNPAPLFLTVLEPG